MVSKFSGEKPFAPPFKVSRLSGKTIVLPAIPGRQIRGGFGATADERLEIGHNRVTPANPPPFRSRESGTMSHAVQNAPESTSEKVPSEKASPDFSLKANEELTLADMMKILDVAHGLQADRETVHEQLSIEKAKAAMRERLLASRELTGAGYTEAELDAAIDLYYDNLHRYREPTGFKAALAHAYIRRGPIGASVGGVAAASALVWGMFFNPLSPWSNYGSVTRQLNNERAAIVRVERDLKAIAAPEAASPEMAKLKEAADTYERARDVAKLRESRSQIEAAAVKAKEAHHAAQQAAEHLAKIKSLLTSAQAVAVEAPVKEQLASLAKQADELAGSTNVARLSELRESVSEVENALQQDYEIRVLWRNQASGMQRTPRNVPGAAPNSYLIVEARNKAGQPVPVTINDVEEGRAVRLTKWGEMVPNDVYERIKQDKKSDGVLNDDLYARKQKGYLSMDIVMKAGDGKPLTRQKQLTDIDTRLKERR